MNPLAQTFTYYEPQNGIDGVFVTGIDIYFQSVDPVYGVTLQIRDTVNGVPSTNIIPYATKHLTASQVSASTNASVATNFTFDTPVIIQSNHQYAIVVIPDGGSPNYNIWTSVLGGADVTTGNQVFKNNQLGTLFISSNDLSFTSIPLESIKYNLYTATFNTSGTAIFRNVGLDFFTVNGIIGNFVPNEMVYVSNNQLNIGYANLNATYANQFSIGTTIYQGASLAASTANAVVYFGNTSLVRFSNSQVTWTTGTVTAANTVATVCSITTAPFQNTATFSNATISTPDYAYTDYTVGNFLYVATNNKTNAQVVQVTATVNSTAVTVSPNVNFTNTGITVGRVRGDANLYGYFTSTSRTSPSASFILSRVTSNSLLNFTNSANQYLIGGTSGALATVVSLYDPKYDSITPQFAQVVPIECSVSWGFSGISNTAAADGTYTTRTYTSLTPDTPYQFIDQQRMIMSRSNEVSNTTVLSNSSLQIQMGMGTSNNLISPYTDTIRNSVTLTNNKITPPTWLYGYSLSVANANGAFNVGDNITQTNTITTTTGTIIAANSTYILVTNVTSSNTNNIGLFNANGASIVTESTTGAVANVTGVSIASEPLNASFAQARYISKVVNLAVGQDAEDILTYLGAYRPPGTNIFVYSKVLHAQDSATFNSKDWSFMPESTSQALISSLVNTNDLVELVYTLPSSTLVYSTGITTNNTTAIVTFPAGNTNAIFTPNSFLYLADQSYVISGASVSAGTSYTNGTVVQLTGTAGYLNANATFNVLTDSSGVPVSVVVANVGSYMSNTTITANTVTLVSGAGSGLLLTITGSQFAPTNKFNVRQVVSVPNTTAVIVNSNTSINSSNVAIGFIANLQSQAGAFKYTANNGNVRYVNYVDSVFDNYLSFAIKIVMTSNATQIVPRITDMRTLALQI